MYVLNISIICINIDCILATSCDSVFALPSHQLKAEGTERIILEIEYR